MPATENNRLNLGEPVLQNPSLPDHDRRNDKGMHAAIPEESMAQNDLDVDMELMGSAEEAPDQEFGQILEGGTTANGGRIPLDPNQNLTADNNRGEIDGDDPENWGESTVDDLNGDKH
jgi:hypothetical protein